MSAVTGGRELPGTATAGPDVVIRPLGPADRAAYVVALRRLSPATWRLRWGGPRARLSDGEIDAYLAPAGGARVALAAEDPATGCILGVGRSAPDPRDPTSFEVALVVGDPFQGRGLGGRLLDELLAVNRRAATRRVLAMSAWDNAPVTRLLAARDFQAVDLDHGMLFWERFLAGGRAAPGHRPGAASDRYVA